MHRYTPAANDYEQAVKRFFENVPFHKTIGARLDKIEPGYAEVSLAKTEALCQQLEFLHAGVLIGLADNAVGAAAASLITEKQSLLSTNFAVALMRPGRGERIKAVGVVVKRGKRLLFCEARLYGDDGELLTQVSVTLAVVEV